MKLEAGERGNYFCIENTTMKVIAVIKSHQRICNQKCRKRDIYMCMCVYTYIHMYIYMYNYVHVHSYFSGSVIFMVCVGFLKLSVC